MKKMISIALSPNTEKDDLFLSIRLLLRPRLWIHGDATKKLQDAFQKWLPIKNCLTFSSGRSALYAILKSFDIRQNDEVILQAYTCVAVVDPILWVGAMPIYVDIEEKTLNMSVADLKTKITHRTKAIIVQHTFGLPGPLEEILSIAREKNIRVIEDCAHALGSEYHGKRVGTWGDISFFSFGRDKVISSVFGGLVATASDDMAHKLSVIQQSFDFPSHLWVKKQLLHPLYLWLVKRTYTFFSLGKIIMALLLRFNFITKAVCACEKKGGEPSFLKKRMPNALALIALHQLKKLQRYNAHRIRLAQIYQKELTHIPSLSQPLFPHESQKHIFLRYTVVTPHAAQLFSEAKKHNIFLGDWYTTSIAPTGVSYDSIHYNKKKCPISESVSAHSLNLPTHIQISEQDAFFIANFIKKHL